MQFWVLGTNWFVLIKHIGVIQKKEGLQQHIKHHLFKLEHEV